MIVQHPLSFRKAKRLLNKSDFSGVMAKRAERSADRFFTVLSRPRQKDDARLGLVVAKRNAKLAVQRNRIKRKVRESFRHASADLPPVDVVVIAQRQAAKAKRIELDHSLSKHWHHLRETHS